MNKILVIQTAFIGDSVLTLPMIQKLREVFPESAIDIICIAESLEIFSASPFVNEVILLDKKGKHKSFSALIKFAKGIKNKKYDLIFSPHRSLRTSLLVLFSGVRETYGFTNSSLNHIYKYNIEYHINRHEVQRNLDLIGFKYSGDQWKIIPELEIPEQAKDKVNKYFTENGIKNNFILIAPGSVWPTKRYPVEYYTVIVDYLISKNFQIVISGGKQDQTITSELKNKYSENVFDAAGKFSLIESIQLFKSAKLLITNDSAPAHLGMCANIKVLTIYCSTVPEFGFYPYNDFSRYLTYNDLYCKPCGIHGYSECPIGTFECAYKLKPEKTIKTIEELLLISS